MKYELKDLIDINKVNDLLSSFNEATGFVTAILDLEGNILSKSGWRKICTKYHRKNQESAKNCIFSDTVLAGKTNEGNQYKVYKCLNGLVDVAIPIIINNEHIGNIFTGQFFFEKPDREFFIKQAEKYGFDSVSYLAALDEVPVVTEEHVKNIMIFLLNMTKSISYMATIRKEQSDLIDALNVNEKRYKKAQSLGHVGNWEYNIKTTKFWGSDEAKRIYGFSPDSQNFTTDEVENCVPERIRVHQALIDLIENNKEYNLQFDIITNDTGQRKTIQSVADMERDPSGKPVKVSGVIIDITDVKLVTKELQESVNRFRTLVNTLPDYIWLKNTEGRYLNCNQKFEEFFGHKESEIIGKTDYDFVPKELADSFRMNDKKAMNAAKPMKNEEEIVRALDSKTVILETIKTPMHGEDGSVVGILGIGRDITDRKQAEEELNKYRDNLEELVKERTKELEEKNEKLAKFNKLFVDREFRVKELKDRIKELEEKLKENGIV
jgi:PAS domain S-box-containing protein